MSAPTPDRPVERPQKIEAAGKPGSERPSPAALFAKVRERVGATRSKLGGVLTSLSITAPNVDLSPERAEFAQQEQKLADLNTATVQQLGIEQTSHQADNASGLTAEEKPEETRLPYDSQLQKLNKIKEEIAHGIVSNEVRDFWRGSVRDVDGRFTQYARPQTVIKSKVFYGKQDVIDLQNSETKDYLDACIRTRAAFIQGLQEGKFRYVNPEKPDDPANIDAFKDWIIGLHKLQFYKDWEGAGRLTHGPKNSGFWLSQIQEGLITAVDSLERNVPEDDQIRAIGEFYQTAINSHIFLRVNQSLFMNMVNGMLGLRGLRPIEHGKLDFEARKAPEKFLPYFREEVIRAQQEFGEIGIKTADNILRDLKGGEEYERGMSGSQEAPKAFSSRGESIRQERQLVTHDGKSFREKEGLADLTAKLTHYKREIARLGVDEYYLEQIEGIERNLVFLGGDELANGVHAISSRVSEHIYNGKRVIMYVPFDYSDPGSETFMTVKVLEDLSKARPDQKGKVFIAVSPLEAARAAREFGGQVQIIITDDVVISGQQIQERAGSLWHHLVQEGFTTEQIRDLIEVDVLASARASTKVYNQDMININSYYAIKEGQNPQLKKDRSIFDDANPTIRVTSAWSTADIGFDEDIRLVTQAIEVEAASHGEDVVLARPLLADLKSPYKLDDDTYDPIFLHEWENTKASHQLPSMQKAA